MLGINDASLRLKMKVFDDTGEIEVTFFEREAVKLLGEEKDSFLARESEVLKLLFKS